MVTHHPRDSVIQDDHNDFLFLDRYRITTMIMMMVPMVTHNPLFDVIHYDGKEFLARISYHSNDDDEEEEEE